jgi:hypothetical protein
VHNVVVRVVGRNPGKAALLCAHYDSVPAGPGASDNGVSVAIAIEIARVLAAAPPEKAVVVLLTDGEEAGLLGAEGFASRHRWMAEIEAVVNLDARGTYGHSLLFETGPRSAGLVAALAGAWPRPAASSLFTTVYRWLPNDTDFSVFKERGLPGLNFAFIAGADRYHTPLDDLPAVRLETLHSQGSAALAAVRAVSLARADGAADAVFFDVLHGALVSWPLPWTRFLVGGLLLLSCWNAFRRGAGGVFPSLRAVLAGLGRLLGFLVAVALLSLGLRTVLSLIGDPDSWLRAPIPVIAAFAVPLPLAVAGFFGARRRSEAERPPAAELGAWALSACAIALLLPAGSYLVLIPAWVAQTALLFGRRFDLAATGLSMVGLLPVSSELYDALGSRALPLISLLSAYGLIPAIDVFARAEGRPRRSAALVLSAAVLILIASVPLASDEGSRKLGTMAFYYDEEASGARWLAAPPAGALAPEVRGAQPFGSEPVVAFPWWPGYRIFAAPARGLELPPPEMEVRQVRSETASRCIDGTLRSARGAPALRLLIRPEVRLLSVSAEGQEQRVGPVSPSDAWTELAYIAVPPRGVGVSICVAGHAPAGAVVIDSSPGLPAEGASLLAARRGTATASGLGDRTIVRREITF